MAKRAFLVGKSTLGLKYAEADVLLMEQGLRHQEYEVEIASTSKYDTLRELEHFAHSANPTDTIIFYFSGHAMAQGGRLQLVLGNRPQDITDTLDINIVTNAFNQCSARNKLIILDCCDAARSSQHYLFSAPDTLRILAATGLLGESKELDELQYSFFTHRLVRALLNPLPEVSNQKGVLTVSKLYWWLLKEVVEQNCKSPEIQIATPQLYGNERFDFEIGTVKLPPSAFPNKPSNVDYTDDFLINANKNKDADLEILLTRFSSLLPLAQQSIILEEILQLAWNEIVHNPDIAVKLSRNTLDLEPIIRRILAPICQIGLTRTLDEDDVERFLSTLIEISNTYKDRAPFSASIILSQFCKFILYSRQEHLLETDSIVNKLYTLLINSHDFWKLTATDLYYAHICGNVFIGWKFLPVIQELHLAYLDSYPNGVLSRIKAWIEFPRETRASLLPDQWLAKVLDAATHCRHPIDGKWILLSFFRLQPLYSKSDEDPDIEDPVLDIIQAMPISVISNSTFLICLQLHALLRSFHATHKLKYLQQYEKDFGYWHQHLLLPQKVKLQIEYAAGLNLCVQIYPIEELRVLNFGQMIFNWTGSVENNILKSIYFANPLLVSTYRHGLEPQKGSVLKFLNFYINHLFDLHANSEIEINHFRYLTYSLTKHVYNLRGKISSAVTLSLTRSLEKQDYYPPAFYCQSTRAMQALVGNDSILIMKAYLQEGIKANEYEIAANSASLFRTLYRWYFYGDSQDRDLAKSMANTVAGIIRIGEKGTIADVSWAFYAGILYIDNETEQEFLEKLWQALKGTDRKIYQLALRHNERYGVEITDQVQPVAAKYKALGSIFAATASTELNHPELWNYMATTIHNYHNLQHNQDYNVLEKAATFYSLAKCFARSRNLFDQKYCYNYINCKALASSLQGTIPSSFFLRDTAHYLMRASSSFFTYKVQNIQAYCALIHKYWSKISSEDRNSIVELRNRVDWFEKAFRASEPK